MQTWEIDKLQGRTTSLAFGGLIVISVVILPAFISAAILDIAEVISLSCFSVALPVLAGGVIVNFVGIELVPEGRTPTWARVNFKLNSPSSSFTKMAEEPHSD